MGIKNKINEKLDDVLNSYNSAKTFLGEGIDSALIYGVGNIGVLTGSYHLLNGWPDAPDQARFLAAVGTGLSLIPLNKYILPAINDKVNDFYDNHKKIKNIGRLVALATSLYLIGSETYGMSKEMDYDQPLNSFEINNGKKIYDRYKTQIDQASEEHGVPKSVLMAIIRKESNGNYKAVSTCAAAGIMQQVPKTARSLGLNVPNYGSIDKEKTDCKAKKVDSITACYKKGNKIFGCDFRNDERFDVDKSINAGAKHLAKLKRRNETWRKAFKKYYGSASNSKNEIYAKKVLRFHKGYQKILR